jgi:hypothetical protein
MLQNKLVTKPNCTALTTPGMPGSGSNYPTSTFHAPHAAAAAGIDFNYVRSFKTT